jgi:two-component sensor histidine kinase
MDVTEYPRIQTLEEAEHRLLLEVDHRTKTVLAIVDSVVRLPKTDSPEAYAASVQQRVQALSRTHMLLDENGWQEVALKDIVRAQVGVFTPDDLDADGPPVMIPAPSVQPIASHYTNSRRTRPSWCACAERRLVGNRLAVGGKWSRSRLERTRPS